MDIKSLELTGAFSVQPKLFEDQRGYFFEWLNSKKFEGETGITFQPIQFNSSKSTRGVLRGLHFQNNPSSQAKLIGVTQGKIQDVIVDLRVGSPSFGKHYAEILDNERKNQLFVPKGFAHGFLVLSEEAEIFYAIDDYYSPNDEGGIMYNDPDLSIDWLIDENEIILSEKDKLYKPLAEKDFNFTYNG